MKNPTLITGGAGFIGTNMADRLLSDGESVIVFDNLSRPGVEENLRWLRSKHGSGLEFIAGDVRNREALRPAVERAGQIFHFAAQVAVTTSLDNPLDDFQRNALGTLTVLEEMRRLGSNAPPLLFTSTNKVYGSLDDVPLVAEGDRYEPEWAILRLKGVAENRPLDFHSPYGCSKGAADQYVVDYARTYGLKTIVFRMSCIYGPHQCGTEDQGWVAHFLIKALRNELITLYGDGRQVRDVLFVEDLVDAMLLATDQADRLAGSAFNMGGGPANTISLLQLLNLIEDLVGKRPPVEYADWRPGDQRYYVSNTAKFHAATGWMPNVSAASGVRQLFEWLSGHVEPLAGRVMVR